MLGDAPGCGRVGAIRERSRSQGGAMAQHRPTRMGPRRSMLAGAAVLAAVGLWMASAAFACTVQAHLQTDPGRGDPGAVIRVEGAGFEASTTPVDVEWGGETGVVLASVPVPSG